jgi:hypothetical protein
MLLPPTSACGCVWRADDKVCWLDISVDEAHGMQALQCCQCAKPHSLDTGQVHAATSLLAHVKQRITQQLCTRKVNRQAGRQAEARAEWYAC